MINALALARGSPEAVDVFDREFVPVCIASLIPVSCECAKYLPGFKGLVKCGG